MYSYLPDQALTEEARAVLVFWFGEPPEHGTRLKRWFEKDAAFDLQVRARFLPLYEALARGDCEAWRLHKADCLAYIVVADQFPRHIFRGDARAFGTDALALTAARKALDSSSERALRPVERLFVCLPFQHSEALQDQATACELAEALALFPETADVRRFALAHRDIIRRFGRFPHRNAALGRASTPEELEFLKQPGSSF